MALWFKVMKAWKPDACDILGDIDDQLEYSTFSDGTTDEFFSRLKKEADPSPLAYIKKNAAGAAQFYSDLRKAMPNADIHLSRGNHCDRVFKYVDKKAPEYKELVTPNFLWGVDDLGITWNPYKDKPLKRFADIHVHHGDTTTTTGLAVKSDIENYNISIVRGHDHRGGVVYKTYPLSGQQLVGMGTGHMCDPSAYGLQYAINPSWELGFGICHIYEEQPFMQFIRISPDYTCVVDGKLFKG